MKQRKRMRNERQVSIKVFSIFIAGAIALILMGSGHGTAFAANEAQLHELESNPHLDEKQNADTSTTAPFVENGVPDDAVYDYAGLLAAVQDPNRDIIHIAADVSLDEALTINRSVIIEAVFREDEARKKRTITSAEKARHFIISGNRTVEFRNIVLDGNHTSGGIDVINGATISGVTIQNCSITKLSGASSTSGAAAGTGGAIHLARYRTLVLTNVILQNNQAIGTGGALHAAADTTVTISDSIISGNSSGSNGGGIHLGTSTAAAILTDTDISNNSSKAAGGGAFFASSNDKPRKVLLTSTKISENKSATYGGGIALSTAGIATFDGVTMTGNSTDDKGSSASGGGIHGNTNAKIMIKGGSLIQGNRAFRHGGGIYGAVNSTITITEDSSVDRNMTSGNGGGIYAAPSTAAAAAASLKVEGNSRITNNQTDGAYTPVSANGWGGGICAESLDLKNATISSNTAKLWGGGIYLPEPADDAAIANATITSNTAAGGAGIYGGGKITINDSMIMNNTAARADGKEAYGGGISSSGEVTVENSEITSNKAYFGAGVNSSGLGTLIVKNTRINLNEASYGGGIYGGVDAWIKVYDSTIHQNSGILNASQGGAGGIRARKLLLMDTTVSENTASMYGGGLDTQEQVIDWYIGGRTQIINNKTTSTSIFYPGQGGAISDRGALGSTIVIEGTAETPIIISGNTSARTGGGIHLNADTELNMKHVSIENNTAATTGGGIHTLASLTLADTVSISGNTAGTNGGGVYIQGSSSNKKALTIDGDVQIGAEDKGNHAVLGGGIYMGSYTSMSLFDGVISANTAENNGGGIYYTGSVDTVLRVSGTADISSNAAANNGGGIYASAGTVNMSGGLLTSNTATNGGGIYVKGSAASINGTILDKNTADMFGGGIFASKKLSLETASVTGNSAFAGGGIFAENEAAALSVTDSTLTGNHAETTGGAISLPTANRSVNSFEYYPSYELLTMSGCTMNYNTANWSLMRRVPQRDLEIHGKKITDPSGAFSEDLPHAYNTYDVGSHFSGQAYITFDGNGSTTKPETSSYLQYIGWNQSSLELLDSKGKLPLPSKQKKTGYIFRGWNTKSDGSGDTVADDNARLKLVRISGITDSNFKDPSLALTLYAIWDECDHSGLTKKPDCENGAVCSRCGKSLSKLGHDWGKWSITKSPALDTQGMAERICLREQDHSVRIPIPALHDEDIWKAESRMEPTCEETGTLTYTSQYGTVTTKLPARGHDWGNWAITESPALDTQGMAERVCLREQDHSVRIPIPALHDEDVWKAESRTEPTCEETGTLTYTSQYGTVTTKLPARGHDWGKWRVTLQPTPVSAGEEQRECLAAGCNHKETRSIKSTVESITPPDTGKPLKPTTEHREPIHSDKILDTGDGNNIGMLIILAILSFSGIIITLIMKRKHRR